MYTNFNTVTNVKDYLSKNKYIVYVTNDNTSTYITDYNNQEIYKRIYLNSEGNLEFKRFATEKDDTTSGWQGLYPRVELVAANNELEKNKPYHVRYEFSPLGVANSTFRAVLFQFFDHGNNKSGLPLFQLLIGNNKLQVVYRTLDNTGDTIIDTTYVNIADVTWNKQWFNIDIYCNLKYSKDAYIKVYCNDKKVFERINVNASNNNQTVQIQYGVYGKKGIELRSQVRLISWEIDDGKHDQVQEEFIILAIGQSNMIGASASDNTNKLVSSEYSNYVSWYDYNTPHTKADNSLFRKSSTMIFQSTKSSSSPAKFCANKLLTSGIKPITIIPMAKSGTSIDQWKKGYTLFDNTVKACKEVFSLKPKSKIDLVIWIQGETNRYSYTGYEAKLASVMSDFDSTIPQWDANTILVLAEISSKVENANLINNQIKNFVSKRKNTYLVDSSEYPTNADNMHFNQPSIIKLGTQFAQQYLDHN